MEEKLKKHGAISWSELLTTDAAAAKTFYGDMFGWKFQDLPMEGGTYVVLQANGDEVGGLMTIPDEAQPMPPMWGLYITVDDVDNAAEKATTMGGKVLMPPRDIPEVGRFCVLQDPQGACISIITYSS